MRTDIIVITTYMYYEGLEAKTYQQTDPEHRLVARQLGSSASSDLSPSINS